MRCVDVSGRAEGEPERRGGSGVASVRGLGGGVCGLWCERWVFDELFMVASMVLQVVTFGMNVM